MDWFVGNSRETIQEVGWLLTKVLRGGSAKFPSNQFLDWKMVQNEEPVPLLSQQESASRKVSVSVILVAFR